MVSAVTFEKSICGNRNQGSIPSFFFFLEKDSIKKREMNTTCLSCQTEFLQYVCIILHIRTSGMIEARSQATKSKSAWCFGGRGISLNKVARQHGSTAKGEYLFCCIRRFWNPCQHPHEENQTARLLWNFFSFSPILAFFWYFFFFFTWKGFVNSAPYVWRDRGRFFLVRLHWLSFFFKVSSSMLLFGLLLILQGFGTWSLFFFFFVLYPELTFDLFNSGF